MEKIINATLCYLIKDNKVLMLHRTKKENDAFQNFWNGLGGKMELNESPEDCVKREMFEESGLKIDKLNLRGINTFPNNRGRGDTWTVFVYEANDYTGSLNNCNEGDLEWISLDKIKELNIQQADHLYLKWLLNKHFFSARFTYEKDELINHEVSFY